MGARLPSGLMVSALLRMAEAQGGFATVLAKGDPDGGAIAVILMERGADPRLLERVLQPDGDYRWAESAAGDEPVASLASRRRRNDPDLWLIELDIAQADRFAAEMIAAG